MSKPTPVVLCILDGWGLRDDPTANAPRLAETPAYDRIMTTCPNATLITHGRDVGLPTGQMGNSEVGHTNIGAGRVVAMDLGQIDLAIEDGSFFSECAIVAFAEKLKETGGTAHLIGLVSDGGVHSHQDHIVAAAKALADRGVTVVVHAITDGRDVPPKSAEGYLAALRADLPEGAEIVTVESLVTDGQLNAVQQAFIQEGAAQCGYCIPGIVIAATGLLKANANPNDADIAEALEKQLCRCGSHANVIKAIKRVAAEGGL